MLFRIFAAQFDRKMMDKRTLEFILSDQQEELEAKAQETLCHRREEAQGSEGQEL